jgi:hypothetical protein
MSDPSSTPKYAAHLARAEELIYIIAGYILVLATLVLLLVSSYEVVIYSLDQDYFKAMVHLLDRILLVLMLAEIIYTIGRVARTKQLEATPFLIVGIIAAVRRILIITAESGTHIDITDKLFQGALAELGLLAFMVLILSISLLLVAKRNHIANESESTAKS